MIEHTREEFCLLVHNRNPYIANAGTEMYIQIQTDYLLATMDVLVIFPVRKDYFLTVYGWGLIVNKRFLGVFDERHIIKYLSAYLIEKKCEGVLVHHLKWCNIESLSRILSFSDRILFYVHDYYTCCIQANLLKNDEEYCGDAVLDSKKCSDCKIYKEAIDHKKRIERFFAGFERIDVIAPSKVAGDIWRKAYEKYSDNISVVDHLIVDTVPGSQFSVLSDKDKINVAFVGLGDKVKGWELWKEALTRLTADERYEYNFYHFGQVFEALDGVTQVAVSISKDGPEAMTEKLKEYSINVAVLYSIWPETYSYTYFEAMKAGCFIITNDRSGNIVSQVEKYDNGMVLECTADSLKNLFMNPGKLRGEINRFRYGMGSCNVEITYNTHFAESFGKMRNNEIYSNVKSENMPLSWLANFLYRLRYRGDLGKE